MRGKGGDPTQRTFRAFPERRSCDPPERLTLNSAWALRKHHSELLTQTWVVNHQEAGNRLGEACVGTASIALSRVQGEGGLSMALTLEKPECETERYHVILLVQKHLKSIGLGLCGLS